MDNILLIDIGNTAVKWTFNGEYSSALASDFSIDLLPKATQVLVSCVGEQSLLKNFDKAIFVKSQAQFNNFKSAYKKSQDLGVDRFLAMIASIDQYPNQTRLIIDAGSALTFDLVLAGGEHQGGLIMPGLGVLRRSFTQFSSDSKQLALEKNANNTKDAWEYGTAQMFMSVINHQVETYLTQYGDLQIILTGGDAKIIAYRLKHAADIKPHLVLDGLALYAQA
ncbi:type III pantothenate kinase [Candidatus Thioglobus autotrophicus]|uniref:type III pantothenate kinase n=1 Tax=Candidatus Thioglobus autotrophicus TaxID=1705394 RepID=UPI00299D43FF|nr:type III pantothenate kinase [Candidatus Thioglobus autotrophicus]WPE17541.1 type III pantothenate kinase [Candidatus Thioglobus autotrophicus]